MNRIVVFCGSSFGSEPIFTKTAKQLGQAMAKQNIGLVYGGANVGLMGAVADGALAAGGEVIGILPNFLKSRELAHQGLSELILVESMHERKAKMNELSDGIIALPGGIGTLEELFEMLTWGVLGLHKKPVGIVNVDGFYNDLLNMLDTMVNKGFLAESYRHMLLASDDIDDLLTQMQNYQAPTVAKWMKKGDS